MADPSAPLIDLKARISEGIISKFGESSEAKKLYDDYKKKSAKKELEKNQFLTGIVDFLIKKNSSNTNNIKADQAGRGGSTRDKEDPTSEDHLSKINEVIKKVETIVSKIELILKKNINHECRRNQSENIL